MIAPKIDSIVNRVSQYQYKILFIDPHHYSRESNKDRFLFAVYLAQ